jgi:hypothetical protein
MKFIVVFAALVVALCAYVFLVRPYLQKRPEFHEFYNLADGFWQRVGTWIKIRWDMAVAAIAIVAPEIPDLLTQLQAMDLASFSPSETWKTIAKVVGIALPFLRAFILKKFAGG